MHSYTVYVAQDGAEFDTEEECKKYENDPKTLVRAFLKSKCFQLANNLDGLTSFIIDNFAELAKIINKPTLSNDGWISNVGRDKNWHPESLSPDTRIEVIYREGSTATGWASTWHSSWQETNGWGSDIAAYRILKD